MNAIHKDKKMRLAAILIPVLLLSACGTSYSLVKPEPVKVSKGSMQVQPTTMWNRTPYYPGGIASQESWTQNGLPLDQVWFFGGVKDGATIARQDKKAARQVPAFKSDMLPQDLVSLLESFYLIVQNARIFKADSVKPVPVSGVNGIRVDFSFSGYDEVKRKGVAVLAVKDEKLYGMVLHAAELHYYDTVAPEFDKLVASAVFIK